MKYRYPGIKPFSKEERDIFFGRDADCARLFSTILLEKTVLLYSKSGLGKSSLLQAGIVPQLLDEQHYTPLSIRFGACSDGSVSPVQTVLQQIADYEQTNHIPDAVLPHDNSLWKHFKQRTGENAQGFVLIFDQFEELFTYAAEDILEFKRQLADLLYTKVPQAYREKINAELKLNPAFISDDALQQLYSPIDLKAVFSIRSDRLSMLNQLTDYLPSIQRYFFELKPLSRTNAREAITLPAEKEGEFLSHAFDFQPKTIDAVLNFLSQNDNEIESSQLQIICQYIEQVVIQQAENQLRNLHTPRFTVTSAHLGDLQNVFDTFYDTQIRACGTPNEQALARTLIEFGLIFGDGTAARRISLFSGIVADQYHISEQLINRLVDSRLLRAERNAKNDLYYEVSHDTLIAPILKSRKKRLEEEQLRIKNEELRIKKVNEERERLERERQIRRQRKIIAVVGVAALLAVLLAVFSISMWRSAGLEREKAKVQSQIAMEQSQKAQQQTAVAETERKSADSAKNVAYSALKQVQVAQEQALKSAKTAAEKEAIARQFAQQAKQILSNLIQNPSIQKALLTTDSSKEQSDEYHLFVKSGKAKFAIKADTAISTFKDALLNFQIAEFSIKTADTAKYKPEIRKLISNTKTYIENRLLGNQFLGKGNFEKAKMYYEKARSFIPEEIFCLSQLAQYQAFEPEMVPVAAGEFLMGDSTGDRDEKPVHKVTLSEFAMSKYECTNAQFARFVNEYGCDTVKSGEFHGQEMISNYLDWGLVKDRQSGAWLVSPSYENHPIVYVTWFGATEYAIWLSQKTGKRYQLPTEAQWEYAARGGNKNPNPQGFKNLAGLETLYAGSDSIDLVAWYYKNSGNTTHPVGKKLPNQLQIYDMSGNVWEWCADWYTSYIADNQVNPTGAVTGSFRVARGGSWFRDATNARVVSPRQRRPYRLVRLLGVSSS